MSGLGSEAIKALYKNLTAIDRPLVLGSSSFSRLRVLQSVNIPFSVAVADIDEEELADKSDPVAYCTSLAHLKAVEILKTLKEPSYLITCDQIVLASDRKEVRNKPKNKEEVYQFCESYSNSYAVLIAAVEVTRIDEDGSIHSESDHDVTLVHYDNMTDEDFESLSIPTKGFIHETLQKFFNDKVDNKSSIALLPVLPPSDKATADVYKCAGAVCIEHPTSQKKINKIEGSLDSVYGLPLHKVDALIGKLMKNI